MKKILCLILSIILLLPVLASCQSEPVEFSEIDFRTVSDMSKVTTTTKKTDYVLIEVKDYGQILVRLFPDVAPKTVKRFKELVAEGFYDGLIFHRVIENFMIQGGDADGDGIGNPSEKNIKGEFNENGFKNNLKHVRGVVSMARATDMDSASTQFFICQEEYAYGNGKYASFGFVVNGMSVVDAIAAVDVSASSNRPYTDVVINSIKFAEVPDDVLSDVPEAENEKKNNNDTVIENTTNSQFDLSQILSETLVSKSETETDYVCLDIESYGKVYLRLFPETAPQTVSNFKKLVSEGFYDGLIFHRVIKDFMIQGGDPDGNGKGGSSEKIYGEFLNNGFNNQLKHTRGVISMARRGDNYNSASSQFFICQRDYAYGDGDYASFGYVISGMDVVDTIANIPTDSLDKPIRDIKISSAYFVDVPARALEKGVASVDLSKTTAEVTNYVVMDIKDYGNIVFRLYPEVAPLTTANFQKLVAQGFYDGLTIHRVSKDFILQGGDPLGTGYGDSGETIKGEFALNGVDNDIDHVFGVLSMARLSNEYDSASCQFFICHNGASGLNGKYASFGYAISGNDVINAINNCEADSSGTPIEAVVINSIKFINVQE